MSAPTIFFAALVCVFLVGAIVSVAVVSIVLVVDYADDAARGVMDSVR